MINLSKDVKTTRGKNAVAAGTSNQTSSIIDMAGFAGVRAVALLGTLTATQVTSLKAQVGNASDGSDMADLSGAVTANMADADSNKLLILDVLKPSGYRYIQFVIQRATANAVIDGLLIDQYGTSNVPVTQGSTVSQTKTFVGVSP